MISIGKIVLKVTEEHEGNIIGGNLHLNNDFVCFFQVDIEGKEGVMQIALNKIYAKPLFNEIKECWNLISDGSSFQNDELCLIEAIYKMLELHESKKEYDAICTNLGIKQYAEIYYENGLSILPANTVAILQSIKALLLLDELVKEVRIVTKESFRLSKEYEKQNKMFS